MRKKIFLNKSADAHPDRIFVRERDPALFSDWLEELREKRPLSLELGMGTGDFLLNQAKKYPNKFFLGIESKKDRVFKAFRKADEDRLDNIAFLQTKIENLKSYNISKAENLFLFFPDPWPKRRHARKRLSSAGFLDIYQSLLKADAHLFLKTDDPKLFSYSLEIFEENSWKLIDRQESYLTPEEERTAYEKKFLCMGKEICFLETKV